MEGMFVCDVFSGLTLAIILHVSTREVVPILRMFRRVWLSGCFVRTRTIIFVFDFQKQNHQSEDRSISKPTKNNHGEGSSSPEEGPPSSSTPKTSGGPSLRRESTPRVTHPGVARNPHREHCVLPQNPAAHVRNNLHGAALLNGRNREVSYDRAGGSSPRPWSSTRRSWRTRLLRFSGGPEDWRDSAAIGSRRRRISPISSGGGRLCGWCGPTLCFRSGGLQRR